MFNLSVLRLFFPYGPGQRDRLIPDLIRRVRTRQAVHLGEDGEGLQFAPIFIDDVVSSFSECVGKRVDRYVQRYDGREGFDKTDDFPDRRVLA